MKTTCAPREESTATPARSRAANQRVEVVVPDPGPPPADLLVEQVRAPEVDDDVGTERVDPGLPRREQARQDGRATHGARAAHRVGELDLRRPSTASNRGARRWPAPRCTRARERLEPDAERPGHRVADKQHLERRLAVADRRQRRRVREGQRAGARRARLADEHEGAPRARPGAPPPRAADAPERRRGAWHARDRYDATAPVGSRASWHATRPRDVANARASRRPCVRGRRRRATARRPRPARRPSPSGSAPSRRRSFTSSSRCGGRGDPRPRAGGDRRPDHARRAAACRATRRWRRAA